MDHGVAAAAGGAGGRVGSEGGIGPTERAGQEIPERGSGVHGEGRDYNARHVLTRILVPLALIAALPARAEPTLPPEAPKVSVRLGWGAPVAGLQPAEYLLENPGTAPARILLKVEPQLQSSRSLAAYEKEVEIPPGGRQRHALHFLSWAGMLPPKVSAAWEGRELVDEDARVQSFPVGPTRTSVTVLTSGSDSWLQMIRQLKRPGRYNNAEPVQAVAAMASDIPEDPADFGELETLVVSNPPSGIQPAQWETLATWIAGGHHLVLTASPQGLPAGLVERIPPLGGFRPAATGDFRSLETAARLPLPPHGEAPVLEGAPAGRAATAPFPRLQRFAWGYGRVTVVGVDPAVHPFRGWDGMVPLWNAALSHSPPAWADPWPQEEEYQTWRMGPRTHIRRNLCLLLRDGMTRTPQIGHISGIVIGYLIAVAVLFIVMRRRASPVWLLAGIPALSVGASLGVLGIGYVVKGMGTRTSLITLRVGVPDAGRGFSTTHAAIITSSARDMDVELAPGSRGHLLYPDVEDTESTYHRHRGPEGLKDLGMKMWASRFVTATLQGTPAPAIALEDGALVNRGTLPFEHVHARIGTRYLHGGPLAPGERMPIDGLAPLPGAWIPTARLKATTDLMTGLSGGDWAIGVRAHAAGEDLVRAPWPRVLDALFEITPLAPGRATP